MSFNVAAGAYDRFMGRYSQLLAPSFADFADLADARAGQRALDVGCGPGALTAELVRRLGPDSVSAVDPSELFAAAARERHPGVDVRLAPAEELPFADASFDVACAQLAVHFMADPVVGLREMARVTRSDGIVAACVWDFEGERTPISAFWRAAHEVKGDVQDESGLAGARAGHLRELFEAAELRRIVEAELEAPVEHATFEDWWEPFTLGVGPAGAYARSLSEGELAAIRERCRSLLPEAPFTMTAVAWAVRGHV